MKRFLFMVFIISPLFCMGHQYANAQSKPLHPRNAQLIKMGLIPPMKYFPEVPRITAYEAFNLYNSGTAMFVAIGHDAPRLLKGYKLKDYFKFNPDCLRIPKKKPVVMYCG